MMRTDLAAKKGVSSAEPDIVGVLVRVSGALHAARPHNHIVEPAVLKCHLSAPLLDQDAPKQVQDSCMATCIVVLAPTMTVLINGPDNALYSMCLFKACASLSAVGCDTVLRRTVPDLKVRRGGCAAPAGKPILAVPKEVTITYWSTPAATAASTNAMAPSPSIFFGLPKFRASLSGAPMACTTYMEDRIRDPCISPMVHSIPQA